MRCINEVLLFENRKIFRVYFFSLNLNLIPFFYRVMPIILSRNIYVWFNYIYQFNFKRYTDMYKLRYKLFIEFVEH